MSTYNCTIRTNYFKVNNEDAFLELMKHVQGAENKVEVFSLVASVVKKFAFGCYGAIVGIDEDFYLQENHIDPTNEDEFDEDDFTENRYFMFVEHLQTLVAEDDAIIIYEAGNEKFRYVVGSAELITREKTEYLEIKDFARMRVAQLLDNPSWTTRSDN